MTVKLCIPVKLRDYRELAEALRDEGLEYITYPSIIKGYNAVIVIPVDSKDEAYRLGNYIVKTLLPALKLWYWVKEDER
jgi:hypothetical protein